MKKGVTTVHRSVDILGKDRSYCHILGMYFQCLGYSIIVAKSI